jgi:hypothetical protein
MQLHTLFVCLKLPTEKPFSRRIFLWPTISVVCATEIPLGILRDTDQGES